MECPGFYCGRTIQENGGLGECGACPAGSRVNATWMCEECHDNPSTYDWMYLTCMACIPLVFNTIFIDISIKKDNCNNLFFHISAFLESTISFLLALLLFQPMGSLQLVSCGSRTLSDWYSIFFNPTLDFTTTLHCTQEAVYPLYSLVFLMHLLNLLLTIVFRCSLSRLLHMPCFFSLYAALFLHPLLAITHALLAGIIYYSFPYSIIIITMVTNAIHFASFKEKSPKGLTKELFTKVRNIAVVLIHTSCLVFAVSCLLQCTPFEREYPLFCLVLLPPVVYILTSPFTDPRSLNLDANKEH